MPCRREPGNFGLSRTAGVARCGKRSSPGKASLASHRAAKPQYLILEDFLCKAFQPPNLIFEKDRTNLVVGGVIHSEKIFPTKTVNKFPS